MNKRLVSIKIASDILAVSANTLRQWDKIGKLKAIRNKNNKYRLYDISEIQDLIKKLGLKFKRSQKIFLKDN